MRKTIQKLLRIKGYKIIKIYPRPMFEFINKQEKKNLTGAEIGVLKGENAARILKSLDIKHLYLIDPYMEYDIKYDKPINEMRIFNDITPEKVEALFNGIYRAYKTTQDILGLRAIIVKFGYDDVDLNFRNWLNTLSKQDLQRLYMELGTQPLLNPYLLIISINSLYFPSFQIFKYNSCTILGVTFPIILISDNILDSFIIIILLLFLLLDFYII